MQNINIDIPEPFQFLFKPARYKGAYGGRGGGKSWAFARALITLAMERPLKILCAREYQKSIKESVKQLLDDTIDAHGLRGFFQSTKTEIRGINGSLFIFEGLSHDTQKIKSLEGIDICWGEEANVLSAESLKYLIPTIRKDGSELWFSYNRKEEKEPVHELRLRDGAVFVEVNYYDNPFFTETLRKEMQWDKAHDTGMYEHVWLGKPQVHSEAQVFYGKYRIENFDTPEDAVFYFGADWGFSVDPSTLVRCFVDADARKLYVDHEAYAVGVEIEDLPALFDTVPESRPPKKVEVAEGDKEAEIPDVKVWQIKADSARPETISYMRRQGFNIVPAIKGKGSVEDGIEFMRSYQIVIHPRCKRTADEFRLYSYKTDLGGNVTPKIEDKHNHCIDAVRYATEGIRRKRKVMIN
jgi:phage terminase large subunit